ncbi:MAG: hypothetical protein WCP97_03900 [bacterium]
MTYPRSALIFQLYRLGRKAKSMVKLHNEDTMLKGAILMHLSETACTVSEMGKHLHSKISSISEKLIELENNGLITKIKEGDQRERKLELTEAGKKRSEEIQKMMQTHCSAIIGDLNDTEINQLQKLLKKINDFEETAHG